MGSAERKARGEKGRSGTNKPEREDDEVGDSVSVVAAEEVGRAISERQALAEEDTATLVVDDDCDDDDEDGADLRAPEGNVLRSRCLSLSGIFFWRGMHRTEATCDKLEKVVAEWRMWMETKEAFITRAQMFIARSFET